jgi:hypothetical protein
LTANVGGFFEVDANLVTLTFASWNQIGPWLCHLDGLRRGC